MTVEKMAELAMYQMLLLMQAEASEPGVKLAAANWFMAISKLLPGEVAK